MIKGRRERPDPATFAGNGKVEEIGAAVAALQAAVVVFNHELSPVQERNLEKRLNCRVVDRTSLILDIFAQRARSHEGKVQVELAQLEHLSTRLVRGWTHLERQKGGIGLRGPGETQLETDRRLLGKRVKVLKEKLARSAAAARRCSGARASARDVLSVSLVGYTNAGKSTLVQPADARRACTRPTSCSRRSTRRRAACIRTASARRSCCPIRSASSAQLPHTLVAAFRATLEETVHADLLLHVVDASSADRDAQIAAVNAVLAEIGAGDDTAGARAEQDRSHRAPRRGSSATSMVRSRAFGSAPKTGCRARFGAARARRIRIRRTSPLPGINRPAAA